MNKLIKTNKLSYKYPQNGFLALDNITIDIADGDFVAVLGHNGSGKSTLAKHFNALFTSKRGSVIIDGMDSCDETLLFNIRSTVGMVFQNPDNQIVGTVVEEDIAFGPENLGLERDEIKRRIDSALTAVDMQEYRQRAPHQLSGGQKQRVSIAGILAMQPKCIVLDEATSMLDPKGRKELMRTVSELNKQGTTIINITHFMEEAAQAGRVIVMKDGAVLLDGTPRAVFAQAELLRESGLEVPPVCKLARELYDRGLKIDPVIISAEECIKAILSLLGEQKGFR